MTATQSTSLPLAVVTAGAAGIGLVIAQALLRDGFRVLIGDLDTRAGEEAAHSLGCDFRHFDAADDRSIRQLFEGVGTVSALINNVGIRGGTGALWEIGIEDFRQTLEVNLTSHVLASQQVIPGMIAARHGAIVGIASIAAKAGIVGRAPYGLSKWGVLGLTKSLANELAPFGVRANAVLPGIVRGERFEGSMDLHARSEGISREEAFARMMTRQRLKRYIEPSEIADMVAYLVGESGSAITGAFIDVNGGFE